MHNLSKLLVLLTAAYGCVANAQTFTFRQAAPGVTLAGQNSGEPQPVREYATWNPADMSALNIQLSSDKLSSTISGWHSSGRATIGKSTGKWYWEVTIGSGINWPSIAVMQAGAPLYEYAGVDSRGWGYAGGPQPGATTYLVHSGVNSFYGQAGSLAAGKTIGVALDMSAGTLSYFSDGVSQGVAVTGLTGVIYPATSATDNGTITTTANFGQTPFKYPVPAGFNAGLYN